MSKKTNIPWMSGLVLAFAAIWLPMVFMIGLVDPLHQFSYKTEETPLSYKKLRYSGPGIAKNANFDAVIIGASAAQAYNPQLIQSLTGLNTFNLAISGGTAFEQRLMLESVLQNSPDTLIIWQQAWTAHRWDYNATRLGHQSFPFHLYQEDLKSYIQYLTNLKYLDIAINKIFNLTPNDFVHTVGQVTWKHEQEEKDLEIWFANLNKEKQSERMRQHEVNQNTDFQQNRFDVSFHKNVETVVKLYPSAKFVFILPPYAEASLDLFDEAIPDTPLYRQALTTRLLTLQNNYENVKLINFQDDIQLKENLDLYKDLMHFKTTTADQLMTKVVMETETFWKGE